MSRNNGKVIARIAFAMQNQMAGQHVLSSTRNVNVHYAICDALQEPLPWSTEHCVALTRVLEMCSQVCRTHEVTMRAATLVSAQVTCTMLHHSTVCCHALSINASNNMSPAMDSIQHIRPAHLCASHY